MSKDLFFYYQALTFCHDMKLTSSKGKLRLPRRINELVMKYMLNMKIRVITIDEK
jgi:PIN domain nuclease of toxin-antitoxin system